MTIDALPEVPQTSDPTNFAAEMDAFLASLPTFRTQANALAAAMTAVAAGGAVSLQYTFSTTITDADPGAGVLRLNSATQNTSTVIRADLAGSDGSDLTAILALLDDSTSTLKGYITLRHATTATKWLVFSVASLALPTGYRNITVACVASSAANPFADADKLLFDFTPTGDKGDKGDTGLGITAQAVGFTVSGGTTSKTLTVALDANVAGTNTGDQTNISGNAATVTTNANLTGHVTSVGNAAVLGSFSLAQLNTAVSDADVAILGANTYTGAQNTARATVASAASADIWAAAGNQIDWTGTVTATGFPAAPQAGAERVLITAAAAPFTAGANMLIDGVTSGVTMTCAANDTVTVRAVTTTQFKLSRVKYDGTAVVAQVSALTVLHVRDEKAAGTTGGASVAGDQIRTLNTVVKNTITGASLAANDFTLPAGTYSIAASAPCYIGNTHRVRLFNVTDAVNTLLGNSDFAEPSTYVANKSFVTGEFTITAAKAFRLIHFITTAVANNGLGTRVGDTFLEVYADALIRKVA